MTIKQKLFMMTIVPTMTIVLFSANHLSDKFTTYKNHELLLTSSLLLEDIHEALYELQLENSLSSNYLESNEKDKPYYKDLLLKQNTKADISIKKFDTLVKDINKEHLIIANAEFIEIVATLLKSINVTRNSIMNDALSSEETMQYFNHINSQLLELSDSTRFYSNDIGIQNSIIVLKKLIFLQEISGQERVSVTQLNGKKVSLKSLEKLNSLWELEYSIYENIKILTRGTSLQSYLKHLNVENDNSFINSARDLIKESSTNNFSVDNRVWFNISSHRIDDYYAFSKDILTEIKKDLRTKNSQLFNSFIYQIIFTAVAIITLLFGSYLIYKNISSSLRALNRGIDNFFDFLNFKSETSKEIKIFTNDEISVMSKKINDQIKYLEFNLEDDKYFINETTQIATLMKNGDFSEKPYFEPSNPNLKELKLVFNELITLISNKISEQTTSLEELNRSLEDKVYHQTIALEEQIKDITIARDNAIEAEKSKDNFLANMSHEIRTPLNAILGFVTILRKRIKHEKNLHYLNIIDSSGKSLLAIINDILDFSKIQSGKFTITPNEVDPIVEFSNSTLLFASKTYEKHIIYAVYIDPTMPQTIKVDETRVKQIISNLLSNAIKFTPYDGEIKVRIFMQNSKLIISIEDNGIGISEENISKVFSAFEQADGTTTRKYGGTGLGLSISSKLAELMNGDISLTSKEGSGSTFTLSVPVETINSSPKKLLDINKIKDYRFAILNNSERDNIFERLIKRYLSDLGIESVIELDDYTKDGYDILFFVPSDDYNEEIVEAEIPSIAMLRSNRVKLANIPHITSLYAPFVPTNLLQAIDDITVENIQDIPNEESVKEESKTDDEVKFVGHILVAEDNKTNQMLIGIILEDYGLDYKIANNGLEAVDMYRQYSFDLVLMDENMPELNGIGAMKKIKEYEEQNSLDKTPIIALTANALTSDINRFLSEGMDGFVAKPINTTLLETELNKYLQRI